MYSCNYVSSRQHVSGIKPPLCSIISPTEKIAVFWHGAWRDNQKEIPIREQYVRNTLAKFFKNNSCFHHASVMENIEEKNPLLANESTFIDYAKKHGVQKILVFRFEELGPNIIIYLSPILWQTKNEIVMRIKLLDIPSGKILTSISLERSRGGPFTLNGAGSLEHDLYNTLEMIFSGK